ncbi:unnamed protein product [Meganyctiphanes norvegica]|uniref:Uncharacterized protein n=1 Tax=Meganyctiphanes norvegica TaxID=48144 RepID=A0AAV2R247_MEGNR
MDQKVGGTYSKFYVTLEGSGSDFTETSVTCEDAEGLKADDPMHCFAYFTGLTADTDYAMSVNPSTDGTNDIKDNTVTLTKTHTPKSAKNLGEKNIRLTSFNILWQNNLRNADIDICFKHHDISELSKFQAILINKHGQTQKINEANMKNGNEVCISASNLDIGSFHLDDLITLVVIKRGEDGFSVLASGHTEVSFVGNQIIH